MNSKYLISGMSLTIFMLILLLFKLIETIASPTNLESLAQTTQSDDWLSSIKKETLSRTVQAKLLIQPHFPKHDLIILESHPAPGGALVVTTTIAGKERTFIVLADNKNFIEGVLNSPYLDAAQTNSKHTLLTQQQGKLNSRKDNEYKKLKSDFKIDPLKEYKVTNSKIKTTHPTEAQVRESFVMPERSTNISQATKRDLLEQAKIVRSVVFGKDTAPSIYVFFDFQCSACLQAHKTLQNLTLNGVVKVHYIPVGGEDAESVVKSAYTLISSDNEKRKVVFNHMRKQIPLKKLITTKAPEAEFKQGLDEAMKNKKLYVSLPNPATPTLLYEHAGISYISTVRSASDIKKIARLMNNQ